MVMKRKTVTKVANTLKAVSKKKGMEVEESSEEDNVVMTRKMLKKPAAATGKNTRKEESEDESEEEEEESEAESEKNTKASKTMKKPAAASKAAKAKDESEEESEEDESEDGEEEEESDEEEATNKSMKKPAAAAKLAKKVESEDEESEDDEEMGAQIVLVPEENKEPSEKEVLAKRANELKAMYVSDLKELALSNGLETGSKEAIIKALLKHEAKARALAQEHKAKIRGAVIKKKQELEALSLPDLGQLCNDMGVKGLKGKPERVQRLLVQWQEADGVDQALAQIARDERQKELEAFDEAKLLKLCTKNGVDPFVKEIAVERISKDEHAKGVYARPVIKELEEAAKEEKKVDMVEALLASEAQRKKERELKAKQEGAVALKMKELKAVSVEELAKRIAKKGLKATGKRDDMIQALFIAGVQEDAVASQKSALQAKSTQELKDLLLLNGLETGSKEHMVKTMLAREATVREELKVFETQVEELASKKQEELEKKPKVQLKALCSSKDLPAKGDQEECIQRILEEARTNHEFDKFVSMSNRNKRKQELMALDKPLVLKICEKAGVDAFVPCIMIERIIAHETLGGQAIVAKDSEQPVGKKARK